MQPAAIENQTRFPCGQCGAKLDFKPGAESLSCPYCGYVNAIEASAEHVVEQDFRETLRALEAAAPREEHLRVKCDACAAEIDRPPNVTSLQCPFCGSNIVAQAACQTHIKPQGVLPFKVTKAEAMAGLRQWVAKLWFAPGALKAQMQTDAGVKGIYLPYWTYDAKTTTKYRGQRGDAYYVNESYTTVVNGKTVRQTRRVRKVRWSARSGVVHNTFDDVLVNASHSLPRQFVEKLEPWDLKNVVDYKDEYLSGFSAESYQIDLSEGFAAAQQRMQPTIHATICADIGGDEQRVDWMSVHHDAITFKHLLLPVWLLAYRFKSKAYRTFVNARTGEVQGERPYSWGKISVAIIGLIVVVAILVLLLAQR
ncbi:MAG: hypothetical protein SFZ23_06530 [Planctomycetota bacterium]|nr:hypothetical protein [Planctomycetota bacterium]